jgi:TonB family protein
MAVPQPPGTPSLARSARPKHDYRNLRLVGASRFAGRTIKVRLTIDEHGRVGAVQLLQGVDRQLDRKTIELVRGFEYDPALDDVGEAIPGTSRWDFQIVEDEDAGP